MGRRSRHASGGATRPRLPEGTGVWLVTDLGKTTKHGSSLARLPLGARVAGNSALASLGGDTVALEWVETRAVERWAAAQTKAASSTESDARVLGVERRRNGERGRSFRGPVEAVEVLFLFED